jgi:hypothetical protein
MAMMYGEAEEAEKIANNLVGTYHPELATARFRYIFKEKASKKGNKPVMGSVKKMSDLMVYLINVDFMVEIPLDIWNELDNTKRTALVDHLLERCSGEEDEESGEMKWKVREPDVHEFSSILRRYGAWTTELAEFSSIAKSLDLDFMTDEAEETETVRQNF